jgi:ppGpp synthetase/RelA/SpoT-type nucleotidyltranferase
MKSIEEKIKGINLVSEKFDNIRSEFISSQQIIVNILKNLIDEFAVNYSLTKANSVRNLKFYGIVHRVKEKESFSEKLIRNNDYNLFIDNLVDLGNINQPELKTSIKEIDDLIGIKILTDLNIDSINMFKLISSTNFIKKLSEKGIEINPEDISIQPVRMKNGLNIFKLRCTFETWKFELQIKSKLESAWGDMEHSIFYKDYKITPVRDLAQQSMNHIGKLLIEIDQFLQEIRNANANFSINSDVILFINQFETLYAKKVADALNGINYNFKKIASITYNINNLGNDILKDKELIIDHLSLKCPKYSFYIDSRNKDFDLQIFESIILSSLEEKTLAVNIESNLDNLFDLIKSSYKKMILDNKLVQDDELAERYTTLFFNVCITNNCNEFILNTKNVFEHINNFIVLEESIDALELELDEKDEILSIYSVYCFKGDLEIFISKIDKYRLLYNLEKSKIELKKIDSLADNITINLNSLINILG